MKDPIQELYDRIDEQNLDKARNHRKPALRFYASEAGDCMRRVWYRLRGVRPEPNEAMLSMYGIQGDADHDLTRQLFNHYDIPIGAVLSKVDGSMKETKRFRQTFEVELAGRTIEFVVSGRIDGEIDTPQGEAMLEIKGTGYWRNDWMLKDFEKGGHDEAVKRVKRLHKKWYWQMQMSMKGTDHVLAYLVVKDRATATLGLVNRDTGERTGLYLPAEKEVQDEILKRFANVKRFLDKGSPPLPEFPDGSTECKQCPFYYMCHGARKRREAGLEPAIVYPGPQVEEHHEDTSS